MVYKINSESCNKTIDKTIDKIKEKHKHTFLKLSISFAIIAGVLKDTDPYVASVFVLFSGYFLIRAD